MQFHFVYEGFIVCVVRLFDINNYIVGQDWDNFKQERRGDPLGQNYSFIRKIVRNFFPVSGGEHFANNFLGIPIPLPPALLIDNSKLLHSGLSDLQPSYPGWCVEIQYDPISYQGNIISIYKIANIMRRILGC